MLVVVIGPHSPSLRVRSAHESACDDSLSVEGGVSRRASKHPKRIIISARSTEHSKRSTAFVFVCCADSAVHMQNAVASCGACDVHARAVTRERMGIHERSTVAGPHLHVPFAALKTGDRGH